MAFTSAEKPTPPEGATEVTMPPGFHPARFETERWSAWNFWTREEARSFIYNVEAPARGFQIPIRRLRAEEKRDVLPVTVGPKVRARCSQCTEPAVDTCTRCTKPMCRSHGHPCAVAVRGETPMIVAGYCPECMFWLEPLPGENLQK